MSQLFPYRWLPRTFFLNIRSMIFNICKGIYNIFRWIPVIWIDEDWDWYYLAKIMEYKMRCMSKCLGDGYHLNAKRDEKQLKICAELLRRMQEDGYRDWKGQIRDQKFLGEIIGKHFLGWWD